MPIYEYRCSACGHELEALQKFSDAPLVTCPACGKDALVKLVSAAGFQLKGSGWYETDFRGSGAKPAVTPRHRQGGDRPIRRGQAEVRQGHGVYARHVDDRRQARGAGHARCRVRRHTDGGRLSTARATILAAMRRYLIAGLLVWVPLGITIWVLHFLVTTLDQTLLLFPEVAQPDRLLGFHIPGFGVAADLRDPAAHRRGRRELLRRAADPFWESMLGRIPFVKSIYSSVKQVSDTLLSDPGNAFRKALLVEFPHQGSWTIAFLTGTPAPAVAAHLAEEHVSVYVPTTPNPTSGYFMIVPRSRVRELDMTVDEALKYMISMGVVAPRAHAPAAAGLRAAACRAARTRCEQFPKLTGQRRRAHARSPRRCIRAGCPRPDCRLPKQPPQTFRRLTVKRTDYCGRIDRRYLARPSR